MPRTAQQALVVAAMAGLLLIVGRTAFSPLAHAEEPAEVVSADPRLRCRAFTIDPERVVDTSDSSNEVGKWIGSQPDWVLFSVDHEISQKPTGYPQHWMHVCLSLR